MAFTGTELRDGLRQPAAAGMSDAELRSVTVLFADVQGSTSMVQHLDAEQAESLIGPALDIMWSAAERYDGEVSSRGDGIRATFGPPRSAEDHALRACLCALSILDQLAADPSSQIKVRVGIHSGNVVIQASRPGRARVREIFGSTVHIAARLEQTAEPGTACISVDAFELVRGFVHAAPAAPVAAKGIDEPLQRFVLLGLDSNANRWRVRTSRGLQPMVGRQMELGRLRRLLGSPLPPGVTLMRVTGPAGSGKSRLVHECLHSIETRDYQKVVMSGAPQRSHVPLGPVVDWLLELLRARSGDISADPSPLAKSRLSLLGIQDAAEVQRLQALLRIGDRSLVDLPEIVTGDRAGLVAAIMAVLRNVAGPQPVLLVCEDVDNFDQESLDFLARMPEFFADRPILVLATSRSRTRLTLPHAAQSATTALRPLNREQARSLVSRISSDVASDPDVLNAVLAKAGGNPLFIEEICSLMLDGGKRGAQPETGSSTQASPISRNWRIPDRIETIIADRISSLPPDLRSQLRLCSVIGLEVPLWLMSRLSQEPESAVRAHLMRLESHQILYEDPTPSGCVYRFRHELAREVAYRSILDAERVKIHREIIDAIEVGGQNTINRMLEQLSQHAVRGKVWPKAVHYLQQMAVSAAERSGFRSANRLLQEALVCGNNLPPDEQNLRQKLSILLGLHVLAILDLRYKEAESLLDQAEALSREIGDRDMLITAMGRRVRILNVVGRLDEAVELARRAHGYANQAERPSLVPFAAHFLAQTLFSRGELAKADAVLTSAITSDPAKAEESALRAGSESVLCLTTRAMVRTWLADFPKALRDCDEALRIATIGARPYDVAFARFGRGLALLHQRDLAHSVTEFRRALRIARRGEANSLMPSLETGLAHALLRQGELEAAEPLLLTVTRIPLANHRRMILIWAMIGLAWHRLRSGQQAEARELVERVVDDAAQLGYRSMLVEALRARSLVLLAESPVRAARFAAEALDLAQELRMAAEEAHCQLALASIEVNRDESLVSEALASYRQLHMGGWARRVQHGLSHDTANAWSQAF